MEVSKIPPIEELKLIVGGFLISFLLYGLSTFAAVAIFGDSVDKYLLISVAIGQFFFFLLPVIAFAGQLPYKLNDTFRLKIPKSIALYFSAFAAAIGIQLFTSGFIFLLISILPSDLSQYFSDLYTKYYLEHRKLLGDTSIINVSLGLFAVALTPAICEELIFRGFLQRSLERLIKSWVALIISAILFALIHFSIIAFIPLLVSGIVIGIFAMKSGSIVPAILIHFVNNAITISFYYFIHQDDSTIKSIQNENVALHAINLLSGIVILVFIIWRMFGKPYDDNGQQ